MLKEEATDEQEQPSEEENEKETFLFPRENKKPARKPESRHSPFPFPNDMHPFPFSPTPNNGDDDAKDFPFRYDNTEKRHLQKFMFFDQIVS